MINPSICAFAYLFISATAFFLRQKPLPTLYIIFNWIPAMKFHPRHRLLLSHRIKSRDHFAAILSRSGFLLTQLTHPPGICSRSYQSASSQTIVHSYTRATAFWIKHNPGSVHKITDEEALHIISKTDRNPHFTRKRIYVHRMQPPRAGEKIHNPYNNCLRFNAMCGTPGAVT